MGSRGRSKVQDGSTAESAPLVSQGSSTSQEAGGADVATTPSRASEPGKSRDSKADGGTASRASSASCKAGRQSDVKGQKSGAIGKDFPKRPLGCRLSQAAWDKIEEIFSKMDPDGSNAVTKDEARDFFKCSFGNLSVDAMFNEVDVDGSGAIDANEFIKFWTAVKKNGYKDQDIEDELDELLTGGAWVDWKDGRDTAPAKKCQFPKRPVLCRISQKLWNQAEEFYKKIDADGAYAITQEKAAKHFSGAFSKMSVEAMFNEIDMNHHGQITPKEWMKFWTQVKTSGYKEKDIIEEIEQMMEGNAWVDWKDGRQTA